MIRTPCLTSDGLGKRGWTNKGAAKRAAAQFNSRPGTMGKVEVYRCPICTLYHLGKKKKK